ncbi:chemotaxis protein CheW [Minwuia thermotolerans]|mgnify:CR=1 FL=1|jgi:purine-binding chemotaxis protein CheW|uniref:Chemotaxis protein CheW n=1 Tax=Minwuia thermotolerans TaxID=2056226 RepID=A0A2M9G2C9_9PROT|nr:chemotaxis protein CheW [Minwuia thermotolerans]ANK80497.1 MAG: hypothetical protein TEF_06550 [Rhizobiales bacterium NRL2]PJK29879.1 chemotaxis protein CheW [Minwuia thermotolerans]
MKKSKDVRVGLSESRSIVTSFLGSQMFGLPILSVNDIIRSQALTRVPLAPPEVAGVLNLRGRVVTAIDMRRRFGMPPSESRDKISIVAVHNGEWYSLLFDRVGEVVPVDRVVFEPNPPTLKPQLAELSTCVAKLPDALMVILDIGKVLSIGSDLPVLSEA